MAPLLLAALLILAGPAHGFMLPSTYASCEGTRTTNYNAFANPVQGAGANAVFTMYDLSDRTQCVGRVAHAVDPTVQMLGWVACSDSVNRVAFRLRNSNAGPAVAFSARYWRLQVLRVRSAAQFLANGQRTFHLAEFRLWMGSGAPVAIASATAASSLTAATNAPKLIDNDDSTRYQSVNGPAAWATITFDVSSNVAVNGYSFKTSDASSDTASDPVAWILSASTDNVAFTEVDRQNNPDAVPLTRSTFTGVFRLSSSATQYPNPLPQQTFLNGNPATVINTVTRAVKYRYFKWRPLSVRSGTNFQVQEFELMLSGTTLTGLTNSYSYDAGSHAGFSFQFATDGLITTKWFSQSKVDMSLIMDFGSQRGVDAYRFMTCPELPERDPMEWILFGSNDQAVTSPSYWNDNARWTVIDFVAGQAEPTTTARLTYTPAFSLSQNLPVLPVMANRDAYVPWYRLEIPATNEFVVAAFYRNMQVVNRCNDCNCPVMPAASTTSDGGAVFFNVVFSPNSLGGITGKVANIANVFTAFGSTVFTLTNGQTFLAGLNALSNLGAGTGTNLLVPTRLRDLGNNAVVVRGLTHWVGLNREAGGKVYTWGTQTQGTLGYGGGDFTSTSNVVKEIAGAHTGVTVICAGHHYSCMLKSGNALCWGRNTLREIGDLSGTNRNSPVPVYRAPSPANALSPTATITNLHCGSTAVVITTATNDIFTWGYGYSMPFGNPGTNVDRPTLITGLACANISMVNYQTFCLKADSSLWGWGGSNPSQFSLGLGSFTAVFTPTQIVASGVRALAVGSSGARHFCYITTDNAVLCFGNNHNYGLGDVLTTPMASPTPLLTGAVISDVWVGGSSDISTFESTCYKLAPPMKGTFCFGANQNGQLGRWDLVSPVRRTSDVAGPVTVTYTSHFVSAFGASVARLATGETYVFGRNALASLGELGASMPVPQLFEELGLDVDIVLGASIFVALTSSGKVYTWGNQDYGELGLSADFTTDWSSPKEIFGGHTNVRQVCAGHHFACLLKGTSSVLCWGYNAYNQVGDGTTTNRNVATAVLTSPTPSPTFLLTTASVNKIYCGGHVVYTHLTTGEVYAHGYGLALPFGSSTNVARPTLVSGLTCTDLAATVTIAFCVKADGSLWSWGYQGDGNGGMSYTIGNGAFQSSLSPVKIVTSGVSKLAKASSGALHMCFIKTDNTLWCLGRNENYGLGLGDNSNAVQPTKVLSPGDTVWEVFVGGSFNANEVTCVRLAPGIVTKCFGANNQGQLGRGDTVHPVGYAKRQTIPSVTCNLNADNNIINLNVGGTDITASITGGSLTDCGASSKVVTFNVNPYATNSFVTVVVKDENPGDDLGWGGFSMSCTSNHGAWNFGTRPYGRWKHRHSAHPSNSQFATDITQTTSPPTTAEQVTCLATADDAINRMIFNGNVNTGGYASWPTHGCTGNVFSFNVPNVHDGVLATEIFDSNGGGSLSLGVFALLCISTNPVSSWMNLLTDTTNWRVVHETGSCLSPIDWGANALNTGVCTDSGVPQSNSGRCVSYAIWHTSPASLFTVFRRTIGVSGFPWETATQSTSPCAGLNNAITDPATYVPLWDVSPASQHIAFRYDVTFPMLTAPPGYSARLVLDTTRDVSFTPDEVYFSQLVRPVGGLVSGSPLLNGAALSNFRFLWFMGDDPLTGVKTFHPHFYPYKGCSWFVVNPASNRFVEMGRDASPSAETAIYAFKTVAVDGELIAKSSVASNGPHRFLGDHMCGCRFNDTATVDGSCVYANECSTGSGTATCGAFSTCVDSGPQDGYQCQCQPGFAYDQATGRALRRSSDVNQTDNAELNHCLPSPWELLVGNKGIYFKYGSPALNYTYALYHVDANSVPITTMRISGSIDSAPGNTSYQIEDLTPNVEYNFLVTLAGQNDTSFTTNLVIPCGCDPTSRLVFNEGTPRTDDGKPVFGNLAQVYGKVYFTWRDDSLCENSFSPLRLDPDESKSWQILNGDVNDAVVFSRTLQGMSLPRQSLTSSYQSDSSADTTCGTAYGGIPGLETYETKLTSVDDLARFPVGKPAYYCVTASGPGDYVSGLSCLPKLFRVLWEAEIDVIVHTGYPSVFGVARNVQVFWQVYHWHEAPIAADTDDFLRSGEIVTFGSDFTDKNGRLRIHAYVSPFEVPTVTTSSKMLFALTFKKETPNLVVSNGEPIRHEFYCNLPYRPCTGDDPAVGFVSHLSFNQIAIEARDITTVKVSGKVSIKGTEYPDLTQYALGCPVFGAKVCIRLAPGDTTSELFGCRFTDATGYYELPVTMGVRAVVSVEFNGHVFQRVGGGTGFDVVTQSVDVPNVNFQDVTTETLYVDVYGGTCQRQLVSSPVITASQGVWCQGASWAWALAVEGVGVGTRFRATVPASYFEFKWELTSLGAAPFTAVDGNAGDALGYQSYFDSAYSGDATPKLNLTAPDAQDNSSSSGEAASEATKVGRRTITFVYQDPDPALELTFWQYGRRIDDTLGCDGDTLKLPFNGVDVANPVRVKVKAVQTYKTGLCQDVEGTVKVVNNLGDENPQDSDERVNALLKSCAGLGCDLTLVGDVVEPLAVTQAPTPTAKFSSRPTKSPTPFRPSRSPSRAPSTAPSKTPTTSQPSKNPTTHPSRAPKTSAPTRSPSASPTHPTSSPSSAPSRTVPAPSAGPVTSKPSVGPTKRPVHPSRSPSTSPSRSPSTWSQGRATSANFTMLPRVNINFPFIRTVQLQFYTSSGVAGSVKTKSVIIFGDDLPVGKQSIPFTAPQPIAVVRDPPGDASVAYYRNIQTTTLSESHNVDFFLGYDWSIGVEGKAEPKVPLLCLGGGFGAIVMGCTEPGKAKVNVELGAGLKWVNMLGATRTRRSISRTYTWSVQTPAAPGENSDMFLVAIEAIQFVQTNTVSEKGGPGTCQGTVVTRRVLHADDAMNGVGWYSRGDIVKRVIPTLEKLVWDPANAQHVSELNAQLDTWYTIAEMKRPARLVSAEHLEKTKFKFSGGGQAAQATVGTIQGVAGAAAAILAPEIGPVLFGLDAIVDLAMIPLNSLQLSKNPGLWAGAPIEQFSPLPFDQPSLWKASYDTDQYTTKARNSHMISFSGGGSAYTFETSDFHGDGDDDYSYSRTKDMSIKGKHKFGAEVFGFGVDTEVGLGVTLTVKNEGTRAHDWNAATVAGFTLVDVSAGDYFDVLVERDADYGTFVFTTLAGRSKCPWEAGTVARERLELIRLESPTSAVHPDDPALFVFQIANQADETGTFSISVDLAEFHDDVRVLVNGLPVQAPLVFDGIQGVGALTSYPIMVQVFKGSRYSSYAIPISLSSLCDGKVVDTATLQADFIATCPGVSLAGALAVEPVEILADALDQTVVLAARNLAGDGKTWAMHSRVASVRFQFRYFDSDDWVYVRNATSGDPFELTQTESATFHVATVPWDFSLMPQPVKDATIRVRALVECSPVPGVNSATFPELFWQTSQTGYIRVDRLPPRVVSSAVAEYSPDGDIVVEFDEPIRCGPQAKLPFGVSMVVKGVESTAFDVDHNLMIKCEGARVTVRVASSRTVSLIPLYGKKAVLTLTNVKDVAGNLAETNLVHLYSGFANETGTVEHHFHFTPLDVTSASFFAAGLVMPHGTVPESADPAVDVANVLSTSLGGINPERVLLDDFNFQNGECIVYVTVLPPLAEELVDGAGLQARQRQRQRQRQRRVLRSLQGGGGGDGGVDVNVGQALLDLIVNGEETHYALVETGFIDMVRRAESPGEAKLEGNIMAMLREHEKAVQARFLLVQADLGRLLPDTRSPTLRPTTKRPTTRLPTVLLTKSPTQKPVALVPTTRTPTLKPTTKTPTTRTPTKKPTARPSKVPTQKPTTPAGGRML